MVSKVYRYAGFEQLYDEVDALRAIKETDYLAHVQRKYTLPIRRARSVVRIESVQNQRLDIRQSHLDRQRRTDFDYFAFEHFGYLVPENKNARLINTLSRFH